MNDNSEVVIDSLCCIVKNGAFCVIDQLVSECLDSFSAQVGFSPCVEIMARNGHLDVLGVA